MHTIAAKSFKVLIFISIILLSTNVMAANLVWNAPSGQVDGYKVYYGTSASNPSNSVNVGSTTAYNIDNLDLSENVQYFFCVSAYNSAGEGAPCSPVAYTPADSTPPAPPIGLKAE